MSRSYTRNLNTVSLITLCPVCLHSFQDASVMGLTTMPSLWFTETRTGGRPKPMLRRLKIDPEFQSKIPPLTFEELNLLETNILEEGRILSPLIVWNGLIVDGHNRFAILKNHPEIKYTVLEKEFANRYEAIVWICKNQLGRRNLKPEQFKYVLGQQYEAEKLATNFNGNRFTSGDKTRCGQNVHTYKPERTAERIARENNTNEKAVRRAGQFSKGVDAAEKVAPGIKQEILAGSIKPTEQAVAAIAQAVPADQRVEDSSFLQNVGFQQIQLLKSQRRYFALKFGVNLQPSQHRLWPPSGSGLCEP